MVITETQLRARFCKGGEHRLVVEEGTIFTTAARDYIRERGIEVAMESSRRPGVYRDRQGKALREKPEHMTHLRGNLLVEKNHPRIVLRGRLDHLQSVVITAQCTADQHGHPDVAEHLGEVLDLLREILRCEVTEEPLRPTPLLGMDQQQLREVSHHPEVHIGVGHFLPDYRMGPVMAQLNLVRTTVRQVELAAVAAFANGERMDIIQTLNRLSSAIYILECRLLAAIKQERGEQPWMKSW